MARGEARDPWIGALADFDPGASGVVPLKIDGDTAVWRCRLLERDVVLKCWTLRSASDRVKNALRAGRADRHWRNAAWLYRRGIGTAKCVALATDRSTPARRWLVMEHVPGATLLEELASASVRRQHQIARAAGGQLAEFAARGVYNRDHKPSNLIVREACGDTDLSVLDCVAIRRGRRPERMMASLLIEPAGCGVPVRAALAMRALREFVGASWEIPHWRRDRHRLWHAVADMVRAHGDPTPRVNPLAKP